MGLNPQDSVYLAIRSVWCIHVYTVSMVYTWLYGQYGVYMSRPQLECFSSSLYVRSVRRSRRTTDLRQTLETDNQPPQKWVIKASPRSPRTSERLRVVFRLNRRIGNRISYSWFCLAIDTVGYLFPGIWPPNHYGEAVTGKIHAFPSASESEGTIASPHSFCFELHVGIRNNLRSS